MIDGLGIWVGVAEGFGDGFEAAFGVGEGLFFGVGFGVGLRGADREDFGVGGGVFEWREDVSGAGGDCHRNCDESSCE